MPDYLIWQAQISSETLRLLVQIQGLPGVALDAVHHQLTTAPTGLTVGADVDQVDGTKGRPPALAGPLEAGADELHVFVMAGGTAEVPVHTEADDQLVLDSLGDRR